MLEFKYGPFYCKEVRGYAKTREFCVYFDGENDNFVITWIPLTMSWNNKPITDDYCRSQICDRLRSAMSKLIDGEFADKEHGHSIS